TGAALGSGQRPRRTHRLRSAAAPAAARSREAQRPRQEAGGRGLTELLAGDRYRIERELGRGGMAGVYLAHDEALHRPVAVKVLAEHLGDDETFRARFVREARL